MNISKEKISKWIVSEHLEKMKNLSLEEISTLYVGIYSNRPTSWQVVMSRNPNVTLEQAISMEESENLVRIPGMRRSKFIMNKTLASKVFNIFKMDYSKHEWRLKEGNVSLEEYEKQISDIISYTQDEGKSLDNIRKELDIAKESIRSIVNFATYTGDLLRVPTENIWSNRWVYKSAPDNFLNIDINIEEAKRELADRYLYQYGPITIKDLSWWMNIGKKEAYSILKNIDSKNVGNNFWIHVNKYEDFENFKNNDLNQDEYKFLPSWDPILMGYSPNSLQRESIGLDKINGYDKSGNGLPIIMFGNKAIATWKIRKNGKQRVFEVDLTKLKNTEQSGLNIAISNWCEKLGVEYFK